MSDVDKKDEAMVAEEIEKVSTRADDTASSGDEGIETNQHAHLTLWESIKKWRRVVLYSLGMTSAILMYGYDYVIVGTSSAMPSFQ